MAFAGPFTQRAQLVWRDMAQVSAGLDLVAVLLCARHPIKMQVSGHHERLLQSSVLGEEGYVPGKGGSTPCAAATLV